MDTNGLKRDTISELYLHFKCYVLDYVCYKWQIVFLSFISFWLTCHVFPLKTRGLGVSLSIGCPGWNVKLSFMAWIISVANWHPHAALSGRDLTKSSYSDVLISSEKQKVKRLSHGEQRASQQSLLCARKCVGFSYVKTSTVTMYPLSTNTQRHTYE